MRSNNSKVQGYAFILKAIKEQVHYLDVLFYKAIV